MRPVLNTTDRLILESTSPLFRPFFLGGLGFLVLGASLLIAGLLFGWSTGASLLGPDRPGTAAGIGVFLTTFGFFVAIVPLLGKIPYRKQIIVDRASGQLVRSDRTLLRLRQDFYPLEEVRGVEVEEARDVDGDPYYVLALRVETGDAVTLEHLTERPAADLAARLINGRLAPAHDPAASTAGL